MDLKKYLNRYGIAVLVVIIGILLTWISSIGVNKMVLIDAGGMTNAVSMPLYQFDAPVMSVTIAFEMNYFSPLQNLVHIIPDNRVTSIVINGTNVDLSRIPKSKLEDYEKGFTIDLGKHFRFGKNTVVIGLVNLGGPLCLNFHSVIGENIVIAGLAVIICLLLFVLLRNHIGFSRDRLEHTAAVLLVSLFACVFRYYLLPYQSGDYGSYLAWYLDIRQNGFHAFQHGASNYAPVYLYLLGLSTLLPVYNLLAIKAIPILFDFLTAIFVYRIVREFYPKNDLIALFSFFAFLFLPTVWLNSAAWGQCDSIFMSFIVISVYYLLTKRTFASMVFYSIAVAFKLQAVFVGPFYLVFLLLGVIPFRYFFLIPGVYLLTIIPSWIAGRPFLDLLLIYARQSAEYGQLTLNAPNFYHWVGNSGLLSKTGVVFTLGSVLTLVYFFWKGLKGRLINKERFIEIALVFALIVPFFLPSMHDRYFYPADVLALLYAFIRPRRFYIAIIVMMASLFSYDQFLFGLSPIPMQYVALGMAFSIVLVLADLVRDIFPGKKPEQTGGKNRIK